MKLGHILLWPQTPPTLGSSVLSTWLAWGTSAGLVSISETVSSTQHSVQYPSIQGPWAEQTALKLWDCWGRKHSSLCSARFLGWYIHGTPGLCSPQQQLKTPNVMLLGGRAFGGQLGYENGVLKNGGHKQTHYPTLHVRTQQGNASHEPGSGSSPAPKCFSAMVLRLPASRTVGNKFLFVSHLTPC
jgi:hypothetical protein